MRFRRLPSDRAPQLVARFAVVTAFGLALAGALVLFVIRNLDLREAERDAIQRVEVVADLLLKPQLTPADLARPMRPQRRAALDRLLERNLVAGEVDRLSIVRRDGLIVYSTDHRRIGKRIAQPDLVGRALRGQSLSFVASVPGSDGHSRKALTAYVPLVIGRSAAVRRQGAIVTEVDYGPIEAHANEAFFPVAGVFELALIGIFLFLVPTLASASRRLQRHAEELAHRANHDELTGLPNRYRFGTVTQRLLGERADGVAVMLVDLDRFKEINDALGHAAGDELLREAAQRLRGCVGRATLARLGGDEFAIATRSRTLEQAIELGHLVQRTVEKPFILAGFQVQLGGSVGIAFAPDHGRDAETLLQHADIAMYDAKRSGGGVTVYDTRHDGGVERLALMADLRLAIENEELDVWFQPIVSLETSETQAVEALVRWVHPERGLMTAASFVPIAEQTGMIKALNRLVLRKALARQASWRAHGVDIDVTVNLTMVDLLDTALPKAIAAALETAGVPAEGLVLEITETTAMTDSVRVRETLLKIREMGVRLAIDDFGTGHSSLAYLQHLPVQIMKIDKLFTRGLPADRGAEAIVRSTLELARSLGLQVIAEGIETPEQWDALKALGCKYGQGYHLMPAVPLEELLEIGDRADGAVLASSL